MSTARELKAIRDDLARTEFGVGYDATAIDQEYLDRLDNLIEQEWTDADTAAEIADARQAAINDAERSFDQPIFSRNLSLQDYRDWAKRQFIEGASTMSEAELRVAIPARTGTIFDHTVLVRLDQIAVGTDLIWNALPYMRNNEPATVGYFPVTEIIRSETGSGQERLAVMVEFGLYHRGPASDNIKVVRGLDT